MIPSGDLTPISTLPLWVFKIDRRSPQRDTYWEDLETGYITYLRPEHGTFVDEQHLSDFRRFRSARSAPPPTSVVSLLKRPQSTLTREETHLLDTQHLRTVHASDDYVLVHAGQQDVNFKELFEEANPDNFDPNARMEAAAAAINGFAPPPAVKQIRMRRLGTRDGGETPDFPVLDKLVIEKRSSIYSDNPLFNPTAAAATTHKSARW